MKPRLYETLLVALSAVLWVATVARAQPATPDLFGRSKNKAAIKELETGNKYYKLREFERAIDFYKSGQLIDGAPIFLYNLGQSYRLLGDYEQAIWYYERWLAEFHPPPNSKARIAVEKWIEQMRAELEEHARKEPPLEAAPETGDANGRDQGRVDEATRGGVDAAPQPRTADSPRWYSDGLGWSVAGLGAGLLGSGAGLLVNAGSVDKDADQEPDEDRRQSLLDRADRRRIAGAVILTTGAVGLVSGIVRLARTPPSRTKTVEVALGAGWISLRGEF